MRKLVFTSAVLLLGMSASVHAQTYNITGGNWDFQASWNTNATGTPNTLVYDNGEVGDAALLAGSPGIVNWAPALPASYGGTYSGTITTDGSNNVTGGSLVVTGDVGYQVVTGTAPALNSWWAHTYTGLTLNFDTMTASATAYQCHDSGLAPALCSAGGASPETTQFALVGGEEGIGGTARPDATFDGTTLTVFAEGYSAPGPGTDYLNQFTLTTGGGGGPEVSDSDVTEAGNSGGTGDVAILVAGVAAQVDVLDAATGSVLSQNTFFDTAANPWTGIAIDTVSDGNSDGTADDPAIAMVAINDVTGQIVVQTRLVSDNSKVGTHIPFFNNSNWIPIDVAVVNDVNGDGTTGDTAIAVLAESTVDGRFEVQAKLLSNESEIFKETFLNPSFLAGSVESYVPAGGGDSVLAVLGLRGDGAAIAQRRQVSDGGSLANIFGFGAAIAPNDLAVTADGNGDGTADDPALIFSGKRVANGNVVMRWRSAATGAQIATRTIASTPEQGPERITTISSANGNGVIDVTATIRAVSDDSLTIRTRDGATNWIVNDIPY